MVDAAAHADMSPVTWARVERGEGLYGSTLRKLASYLGVPSSAVEQAVVVEDAMVALESQIDAALHADIQAVPQSILWRLIQVSVATGRMRVLSAGAS